MVQTMRNRRELLTLAAAPLCGQAPGVLVSGRPQAPYGAMADGMQFLGEVGIDGVTRNLTVNLRDLEGAALFRQVLEPTGCV